MIILALCPMLNIIAKPGFAFLALRRDTRPSLGPPARRADRLLQIDCHPRPRQNPMPVKSSPCHLYVNSSSYSRSESGNSGSSLAARRDAYGLRQSSDHHSCPWSCSSYARTTGRHGITALLSAPTALAQPSGANRSSAAKHHDGLRRICLLRSASLESMKAAASRITFSIWSRREAISPVI